MSVQLKRFSRRPDNQFSPCAADFWPCASSDNHSEGRRFRSLQCLPADGRPKRILRDPSFRAHGSPKRYLPLRFCLFIWRWDRVPSQRLTRCGCPKGVCLLHHRHVAIAGESRRRWLRDRLRSRLKGKERAVSESSQSVKATRFRSHAAACGVFAANAVSPLDRELLLRMQRSSLERAHHQDDVDGLPPRPPGCSTALAVPRN